MDTLEDALARNPHLQTYIEDLQQAGLPPPSFHPALSRELRNAATVSHLYPVGDPIFIHVLREPGRLLPAYVAIEPRLDPAEERLYAELRSRVFLRSPEVPVPERVEEYRRSLEELLGKLAGGSRGVLAPRGFRASPEALDKLRYVLFRDIVEHGILEPVMRDIWIEDIHCVGCKPLYVVHKIFGMMETNLRFPAQQALDTYLETMTERMGRPVSDSHPIVDGALPNGSRINVMYGEAISVGGSSFTIRKFSDTPLSITQLIAWGTVGARIAAYLWLCLENGMSVFVSGETASGKTTTLNAILAFIKPKGKVLSVEDTPEVLPPHANWQQLLTRERGSAESRVTMYDLLKAALHSRPNYIIVGEIRGAEGAMAFQAMQTGHPTLSTFHASSVGKLIQRFSSDPISVPLPFMNNLNVVLIQMAVYVRGKMLRRVLAVEEIEAYSKQAGRVVTRQVFGWDPVSDKFHFSGRNNSYVLEGLVAEKLGLENRRDVYAELDRRTVILEELVRRKEFDYARVCKLLFDYAEQGPASLPFPIPEGVVVS